MSRKTNFTLNSKEQAVLGVLDVFKKKGDKGLASLSDIAAKAFAKKGTSSGTKGNSWVRNSLRKPMRLGLVAHHGARTGLYYRTDVKLADLIAKQASTSKSEGSESRSRA
jgi:hypothetical protein